MNLHESRLVIWGYENPHEVRVDPLVVFLFLLPFPFEGFASASRISSINSLANGEKNGLFVFDGSSLNP
jgi:hypothetical protein